MAAEDSMRELLAQLWDEVVPYERAGVMATDTFGRGGPRQVSWLGLGTFPTPVERVEAPARVGELWVKRDDLAGQAYGGNKVRKLEFILGAAAAAGATKLATIGGIGSHHVLATAIYGAQHGFEVAAVVFPQPLNAHVQEQLMADAAAGLRFYPSSSYLTVPFAYLGARRGRAWVEAGGSSVAGSYGYVVAAAELKRQIESGVVPRPDVLYVAMGSCGTAAGLIAGLALVGLADIRIVAVRVVERIVCNQRKLVGLVKKTLAGWPKHGPLPPFTVEHRHFGRAYGAPTEAGTRAVAWAAPRGMALEPTYTGKTLAALLADADAGQLDGKRVLFWNTFSSRPMAPLLAMAPPVAKLPPGLQRYFAKMLKSDHAIR